MDMEVKEAAYERKAKMPKYEPTTENVEMEDCIDATHYLELIREVDANLQAGSISEEEAKFLKLCATRWIKFHYSKVAQFYAVKASPVVQRHLERSTMVLIDKDKKFENAVLDAREYFEKVLKRYVTEHSRDLYTHIDIVKSNMVDEEALAKLGSEPPAPPPPPLKGGHRQAGRRIRQGRKKFDKKA